MVCFAFPATEMNPNIHEGTSILNICTGYSIYIHIYNTYKIYIALCIHCPIMDARETFNKVIRLGKHFFFLAMPTACGSSWAMDLTCTTAVTRDAAVTVQNP